MLNKVVASHNPTPENEEILRDQYTVDGIRGNYEGRFSELFQELSQAKNETEKRRLTREMFRQSLEDSKELGDSFDIERHYTTPQITIGLHENIAGIFISSRRKSA